MTLARHPDPFFVKKEYAPSDRETLHKRQQAAQYLLAPHSRLLQFISSHFNATRLCSPHIQKAFIRLLYVTLTGLMHSTGHPLARELRFHIILFSLKVLRYGTALTAVGQYRLKDQLLSAALSWFSFAPRFSFGGNRVLLKAETRLLSDVAIGFKSVEFIGSKDPISLKRLQDKEELLLALLENEQSRLKVWLYPLADVQDPQVHNVQLSEPPEAILIRLVKTAWTISSSLAVYLTTRFQSLRLHREVRNLLLNFPAKALEEPEALNILIGTALPTDVTWQLKVSGRLQFSYDVAHTF